MLSIWLRTFPGFKLLLFVLFSSSKSYTLRSKSSKSYLALDFHGSDAFIGYLES